jgi:hypothetical protein
MQQGVVCTELTVDAEVQQDDTRSKQTNPHI